MASTTARRIRRVTLIGATIGAVLLGSAPAALAAPGDWTQLSTFPSATAKPRMSIIDQPTLARFGSSLQVIWNGEADSGSNYSTAILNGAGAVTTPSREIISNWAGVTENAALISLGGQRFLAFSGLQSTNTGAPYTSGAEYYATSGDGQTFTLGAGTLSASTTAYAAYGNDVVDNAGTPVWIGNAGTTSGISWHSGISPTDPAPAGSDGSFGMSGCCAYNAAGARDAASGAVYGAFYSNSSGTAEMGVQVGQILPSLGAFTRHPAPSPPMTTAPTRSRRVSASPWPAAPAAASTPPTSWGTRRSRRSASGRSAPARPSTSPPLRPQRSTWPPIRRVGCG